MDGFEDFNQPIVIDNGTGTLKVGMSGDDRPQAIVPTIVGEAKHTRVVLSAPKYERVFGEEAVNNRGLLRLKSPMNKGIVTDHKSMTMLWEHVYKEVLKYPSKEHPVLLTEAPNNPVSNRSEIAKTFFEAFDVPALFFAPQPVLSLYASGRLTGCVLDSGHGITQCIPICDGFAINHAITRMDVAGSDVNLYFQHLLRKLSGVTYHTSSELQTVQQIKEKHCELMPTRNTNKTSKFSESKKTSKFSEKDFTKVRVELPDGKILQLGSARFRAPELLFDPTLIGLEYRGIHYCVLDAINRADLDLRRQLYEQVLLSGGSTQYQGFGNRLLNELKENIDSKSTKIKIFAPVERTLTTWVGGSMLSTLQGFMPMWVKKKEYEEHGDSILFKKQFL